MELLTDLHVHSHYSRATSRHCTLEGLYFWGKMKGINIIGTGDFTHPAWLAEIQAKLEPSGTGLYTLRKEFSKPLDAQLPALVRDQPLYFVPTVEIATIFRKHDKTRKMHQLVVMPDFATVQSFNNRLAKIGNLAADGRPVFGMEAKDVLRWVLETAPQGLYIAAHVWTPWFGLFGSQSGFGTIQDAYEELSPYLRALETGLSADPFMTWRLSHADGLAVVSNSDAHSPQKLGREATIIVADPTYDDIIGAIATNDHRLAGTIEFYPEEGKYHADGHRACGVRFTTTQTAAHNALCPVCGKKLVVGVEFRVNQIADRAANTVIPPKRVEYIVPLVEIIAELHNRRTTSGKGIQAEYARLITLLGSEFNILRALPIEAIAVHSPQLALAIERMREGQVYRESGFDGIYGTINVFGSAEERQELLGQLPVYNGA